KTSQLTQTHSPIDWDRLDALFAAVSEQMKNTDSRLDRLMQETDRRMDRLMQETDKQMKATDRKIASLSNQFVSQTGHIVEGLMEPSAFHVLRENGFEITQCCREMEGSNPSLGLNMEIDLYYMDTVEAIAVEVKTYCTKAKINHFLKQMQHFKQVFHKYADMKVYVAMAALKFDKEALQYAREKGILIIRAKKDLFSIEPFEKETLKTF
ncbi:MAG: hypothetical protein MJZ76_07885, partial [Bacteroidales bacterium]|nr:hypothetical protein [Bacteroidales bacterium]